MNNHPLKIFPILILLFLNCSKTPTNQETAATLTGKVKLEAQTNHSGVTVAFRVCNTLYEHFKIDQLFKY